MTIFPTFGFKGTVLPIIDKNDKLYIFVKNECDYRILLNIVSVDVNKFINFNPKSTRIINCGRFKKDLQLKVFYMGRELFDFSSNDIDKSSLFLFSDYIVKNNTEINKLSFATSFVDGCKITADNNGSKPQPLYIKIVDKDTDKIIKEDNFISSEPYYFEKKYFINYEILIFNSNGQKIYQYNLDLKRKWVLINIDTDSLAETLAWIPYVEEFRKKHDCDIICVTGWHSLFVKTYPNIKFIDVNTALDTSNIFASYKINLTTPTNLNEIPVDYRSISSQQVSSKILGVIHQEIKPKVYVDESEPVIVGEYIVITTTSNSKAGLWNSVGGWQTVIDYLISKNIKVVLLQTEKDSRLKNTINMSGNKDIQKTLNVIKHSKLFIGTSCGMSWLSWSLNRPVITINGFKDPKTDFVEGNNRIINYSVCNSCWNDKKYTFDRTDWFWCPRKKNFECSSMIDPTSVINKINEIIGNGNI